jgi:dCMP deaminase
MATIIHNDPVAYKWLRVAYREAYLRSDDPSTQNGAVLRPAGHQGDQVCYGVNHFPRGLKLTPERLADRDVKLTYMEHAERDVIYKAALRGVPTYEATLYVPWFSCVPCARAIISAGITRIIGHLQMCERTPERWKANIMKADAMLDEAGVVRQYLDAKLFEDDFQVLFNGELWTP